MSTQDRRRITGPANAQPLFFAPLPKEQQAKQKIDIKRESDVKAQISRTFLQIGLITNANGSAYLELDGNIISVSVYGPRPIRGSFIERPMLNVNIDDSTGLVNDLLNKKFSNYIENNLSSVINMSRYPKSGIDVFINIISVQNINELYLKLLSLISDTTTLALINSGIEIFDIVSTSFDIENNSIASFIKNGEVVGFLSESNGSLDKLDQVIEVLYKNSSIVKNSLTDFLASQFKKN
jgi:exosome complex component MTR3